MYRKYHYFPEFTDNRSSMFSEELVNLLLQVVKSWQVIVITIAMILYLFLVTYVARTYHRPRFVSKTRPKKPKVKAAPAPKPKAKESSGGENANEELGLEEA
jgi:hypothetical protein